MNIENKFFHESVPDFMTVINAIDKYYKEVLGYEALSKKVEPLFTREGSIIHPKLNGATFQFWAIPKIAPPEHPNIAPDPKDFVAVNYEGNIPDNKEDYFKQLVFRSFSEAEAELKKRAKILFKNEEKEENKVNTKEEYNQAA